MFPIKDNAPTRHFPIVTVALIAINAAVWILYQVPDLEGSVNQLAYHPCEIEDSCAVVGEDWPVTSVSSMFMHGDWLHIIGNMLFLWIFGNNVEDSLGKVRYLVFYLLGGFAATALQTFITLSQATQAESEIPNLGASGAVSAVLGAYLLILPRARVMTVIFILIILIRELPAWIFLGIWFGLQLWQGGFSLVSPEEGGGVAFFAHIGGFVFGMATVYLFLKRRPLRPAY
ncbi:MAG: rhomboid family intramembrane serine protease [Actinobacteria bacterium]|nr:rhomboid family intramembrane serine protease [Actinomycetota bacterium]MBA3739487.1 rhomboid family intramembrane serine protease [Actinomycetota bacterium]